MNLETFKKNAGQLLSDHASTILTAAGAVGVVATAVLTHKATINGRDALAQQYEDWREKSMKYDLDHDGHGMLPELNSIDRLKAAGPHYIPPVLVGAASIASIIGANRMSAQRAAALAAAYGIADKRLEEYKNKVAEKLTGPKAKSISDEISQERVAGNPPKGDVLILADGDVLFYDLLTDRYFKSSVEKVRKAENEINQELFHHQFASLSDFYDRIGLKTTAFTEAIGFNMAQTGPLEVKFDTVLTDDQKPCITMDFAHIPVPDYAKFY